MNTSVVSSKVQQTSCQAFCVMKLKNRSPLIAQVLCWFVLRNGFALVGGIFLLRLHAQTRTHTHVYSAATSQLHNYTNLMPHSPLLIPYSVHIFILALNEGAATCFTPNKSRVRFILHLRQCGWW